MFRFVVLTSLGLAVGCSNAQSTDVSTDTGAFNQIIDGVDEMHTDINSDLYSGDELCGDMLSNTVVHWVESCEGTELEADAKTLLERFIELDTLQYEGGSRDDLKSKVQEISDVVVALQEKR